MGTGSFPQAVPLEKLRKQGALEGSEMIQLATILHTDPDQLKKEWNQESIPHFWTAGTHQPVHLNAAQVERLRSLHLQGAGIYPMMTRYLQGHTGMQWMGYLAEQPESSKVLTGHQDEVKQPFAMKSGAAGLERTLEPLLRGIGPTLVSRMVSGVERLSLIFSRTSLHQQIAIILYVWKPLWMLSYSVGWRS